MAEYLIGLDLGTSSLKGVLITTDGKIVTSEKVATTFIRPKEYIVEFSPEEYYTQFCELTKSLLAHIKDSDEIRAISMAAASGHTMLADKNMKPVGNVISWMDRRAKDEYKTALPDIESVHKTVGWPPIPSFPLTQLTWLKKHCADRYNTAAYKILNITHLFHRLTGEFKIDPSTATTFYLQDQANRKYHKPYLDHLGIDEVNLPEIVPSSTKLGMVTESASKDTGLSTKTSVVLGSFDHPSAARGTGVFNKGDLLLSCGTSWVGFYPVEDRDLAISERMLIDPFLRPDGPWGALFSLPQIGITIDWYIDNLIATDKNNKYDEFNSLSQKATPGASGLTIDLLDGIKDPDKLKETLSGNHSRQEISRAVMESAAFEMKEKIEQLSIVGIAAKNITMVGGPSESPVWTQIIADITGLELRLISGQAAGAIGAAIMAGIGVGIFKDEREGFELLGKEPRIVEPDVASSAVEKQTLRKIIRRNDEKS